MKNFKNYFFKNKQKIDNKIITNQVSDQYEKIGKIVKEARSHKNLTVKELSFISKIPESTINAIENNIKKQRPEYPFMRSILLKLEDNLSLEKNTLNELICRETDLPKKDKKNYIIRKFDLLSSWQGIVIYFLGLIVILFILNKYFISEIKIIEFKFTEEEFFQK